MTITSLQNSFQAFWKDLQSSHKNRRHDSEINQLSGRTCTVYFWFTAISEIYVINYYVILYQFAKYSETSQYYMKFLAWYIFIQATANWACVKYYTSFCHTSVDQPFPKVDHHACVKRCSTANCGPQVNETRCKNLSTCSNFQSGGMKSNSKESNISICINVDGADACNGETGAAKKSEVHDVTLWWWCSTCKRESPPRSHHCKVCKRCILKRDHHCYMTGVCIGYYNQRYFVILSAYTVIASTLGLYFIILQLRETFTNSTYSDYVIPVTFFQWLIGGAIELHHFLMISLIYTLSWGSLAGIGFFTWQMTAIAQGKTTFEIMKKVPVRSTSSVAENFRSVFGPFWGVNFIFPAQLIFRQSDDGMRWNVKPV